MSYDAIVIGAGHNGLATAIILAKAGWKVVVLERNAVAGGAVQTADVTLPGFHHDLFAANLNLFAGSPFFAEFEKDLVENGLEFVPTTKPFSSVFPDGKFIGVSTDLDETIAAVGGHSEHDAKSWATLNDWFGKSAPHMFPLLGTSLPSIGAVTKILKGAWAIGRHWPLEVIRLVLQSTREFVEEHFETREVQSLCAVWGMHLDYSPEVSGGALFPFLETFADGANGMVLGKGGASNMIDAQVSLLHALGGEIRFSEPVDEILITRKRATGVRLGSGEILRASRAVIGNLTPKILFGNLVPQSALDDSFLEKVSAFRHGPGTLMIHLAMDDLPAWTTPEAREYAYVHIAPYMEDMSLAYSQAAAGLLPERPTLVVGQPTAVDPSRSPDGKHVLWVQVRVVPPTISGDAGHSIAATDWETAKEPFADRVMEIIEAYAPGTSARVLGRHVLAPTDLEAANPNLIGGDSLGGSHHLMQHFFLRPFPGWTKYKTPIKNLFMCGASTWPGAGVGAGSGYLLGKQLTKPGLASRVTSVFRP